MDEIEKLDKKMFEAIDNEDMDTFQVLLEKRGTCIQRLQSQKLDDDGKVRFSKIIDEGAEMIKLVEQKKVHTLSELKNLTKAKKFINQKHLKSGKSVFVDLND